ncbi:HNH endonuclease [Diaminobutyricimonas sp. TR449]|uniref:HNH endonuclease n=1 Tax=Diaminobutyricimonas sp. TR449 TaxID=2708076 RepID=UPI00141FAFC3|nr:HNH endonuclease [Diaminobutyricimonas sp. TR449]
MTDFEGEYPSEAYAPDGTTLWWELDRWPDKPKQKYGGERRLAAWLAFNVEVGETFTMPELRAALGDGVVPNEAEHLNRRLRKLREDGWELPTRKDDGSLPPGVYRLDAKGWHPGEGDRPRGNSVSQGVRRRVLDRDNSRCVHCGVAAGEPYPGEPETSAVITIGHRVPNAHGGSSSDLNNLQAECKRCNEPVRQALRSPETLEELRPDVLSLKGDEAKKLESWLLAGHRLRDRVDAIYDRVRRLSAGEREELKEILSRKIRG